MVEKTGTVSAKLCSLQCIFCVQDTKYKQKSKVQDLPARGRKVLDIEVSPILMTFNCQRSKQHQGGLKRTHQADSTMISEYTNLKKLLVMGRERVCAAHKK